MVSIFVNTWKTDKTIKEKKKDGKEEEKELLENKSASMSITYCLHKTKNYIIMECFFVAMHIDI